MIILTPYHSSALNDVMFSTVLFLIFLSDKNNNRSLAIGKFAPLLEDTHYSLTAALTQIFIFFPIAHSIPNMKYVRRI